MRVQSNGPTNAKLFILGEFPSDGDLRTASCFGDSAGSELNRMLHEAGISRSLSYCTYALKHRPPFGDITKYIPEKKSDITPEMSYLHGRAVTQDIIRGYEQVKSELALVRPGCVLATGNLALFILTGKTGIKSWRGSLLTVDIGLDYLIKVIPTWNPSVILRQYTERPVMVRDIKRAAEHKEYRELPEDKSRFIVRPGFDHAVKTIESLIERCNAGPYRIAADIETRASHIACIGVAWSKTDALCVPFMQTGENPHYWGESEEAALVYLFYKLLTHPNIILEGQNFIYDAQYIYRYWHFLPNFTFDTMTAQHSMFSNMRKGLDFLSSMYCETHIYWKDESKNWDPKLGEDQLWIYNCKDCCATYEVAEEERRTMDLFSKSWPKVHEISNFQQALYNPVLKTMNRGIYANTKKRAEFAESLLAELCSREEWINEVVGYPLNIRSTKQMQELFYDILGQKPILSRKTRKPTCDDSALRVLGEREPLLRPLLRKISECRSIGVFLSTFVNAPLDIDGRLRCTFYVPGTETYRFASGKSAFDSGTNFQNIPSGGDDGEDLELPNIRSLFIPDPGYTFFDIDLDSADLRIVCAESNCKEMKAMLDEGLKVYVEVAKEYYHDPSITKHHPKYGTFKSFAHGTHYLGTGAGLAKRLGLTTHETEKLQRWYFGKFPEIPEWHKAFKAQVHEKRYVENIFGYRIHWMDRFEGTYLNQLIAWLPQSTVACLINRAYLNIFNNLPHVEVLLQVHDSLAGQFPTYLGAAAVRDIVSQAKIILPYPDPMIIPVGVKTSAKSWGDCI